MLRRLLLVVVPLLSALYLALALPLAVGTADRQTQTIYLDRLADTQRFAALADDGLRTNRTEALAAEIIRHDELYGIVVALVAPDRRVLLASRPFDPTTPRVRAELDTAFAGYQADRSATVWPWNTTEMVVVEPVGRDTGVIAAVVTISPTDRLRATIGRDWAVLGGVALLLFLAGIVAAVPLARWVLRPVRDLDAAALAITAGRLDARAVAVNGPPELRRLGVTFNAMVDTVAHTLRRQRTFVADASHQLRNPLTSLRLAVDNLRPYVGEPGHEQYEVAQVEVAQLVAVVDALLALTEVERAVPVTVPQPLDAIVAARAGHWRRLAAEAGLALTVDVPPGLATYAPGDALGNVVDELVANAARLSGGRSVTVEATSAGSELVLTVRDDGAGIPADDLPHAAERFWRGSRHQNVPGTGLGLTICRDLAEAWGGGLALDPVLPHGLAVRITLPAAAADQPLTERK